MTKRRCLLALALLSCVPRAWAEPTKFSVLVYTSPDRFGGMGAEHPVAWYQEYDGGRSFYTALGHLRVHCSDPWFLRHVYGGIYWAATGRGIVR